jgi:hypothetical protein
MAGSRNLRIFIATIATLVTSSSLVNAIDFYEIQIYSTETAPEHRLTLELHSNSVTSATGTEAKANLRPYEIHETLEATYGITPHIEIGQYLCTAKLESGNYEYAGSRTKVHMGFGDPEEWPVALGVNLELDYMRQAAEENPLSFELRPIFEKRYRRLTLVINPVLDKSFNGPGTHDGVTLGPQGLVSYDLFPWMTPAVEYYSDLGPIESLPSVQNQQHFVVPAINLNLAEDLELNFGVGVGLTRASNGVFVKSIVGWTF